MHNPQIRQGWRLFHCDECACDWREATRDALSPSSSECPKCNESSHPIDLSVDATLNVDNSGNLTMPIEKRVQILDREAALVAVWNKLDEMWQHHGDGSDFFPVPQKFRNKDGQTDYDKIKEHKSLNAELHKLHPALMAGRTPEISLLFDIVFNEIQHLVSNNVSREARAKMNGYVEILDRKP